MVEDEIRGRELVACVQLGDLVEVLHFRDKIPAVEPLVVEPKLRTR